MTKETCQCPCNTCGVETEHDVTLLNTLSEEDFKGKPIKREISAVSCRGCKTAAIREKIIKDNTEEDQLIYKPPRLWIQRPKWVEDLDSIDPTIYGLLLEVYSAANDDQFRLLSMGVRSALDHVMTYLVGDIGGFEKKLDEMVKKKHISENQKDLLLIVIDAGSATAHRGFRPAPALLEQMIAVMETIIRQLYLVGPMLETLKTQIPPRPPPAGSKPPQKIPKKKK